MPSYLDEDVEKKLFTIFHKKFPERAYLLHKGICLAPLHGAAVGNDVHTESRRHLRKRKSDRAQSDDQDGFIRDVPVARVYFLCKATWLIQFCGFIF